MESLNGRLSDFGYRGSSSVESAAIGGCAHLVNFERTTNVAGLLCARKYYRCDNAASSIPSAEHSTITSWGKEHELDAMRNLLVQFPKGLLSCVSDSYDIFNACENYWGDKLKEMVERRQGILFVRPDSGDPATVVVKVLEILGRKFGTVTNTKGYKQLPPYLRVIQGDGVNINTLDGILGAMKKAKWSAENIAFGSGGALLQQLDRDTQKCAFKCSNVTVNGINVSFVVLLKNVK